MTVFCLLYLVDYFSKNFIYRHEIWNNIIEEENVR